MTDIYCKNIAKHTTDSGKVKLIVSKGGTQTPINGALYVKFNSDGKKIATLGADRLKKAGLDKTIGEENFCANIDAALARAQVLAE